MLDEESPPTPQFQRKERLKWIASLLLAILVACSGCGFFFTVGLVARGELTANVLGTDLRLWAINAGPQTGVGFSREVRIQQVYYSCSQNYITIVLWKPRLNIDNVVYDNCR